MNPFKKMVLSLSFQSGGVTPDPDLEPNPDTQSALRSSNSYATTEETNICIEPLNVNCQIMTRNINQITSGDIMYDIDGVTVFNGNNKYYNVALSTWTSFEGTRVCFIGTMGEIGVNVICAS